MQGVNRPTGKGKHADRANPLGGTPTSRRCARFATLKRGAPRRTVAVARFLERLNSVFENGVACSRARPLRAPRGRPLARRSFSGGGQSRCLAASGEREGAGTGYAVLENGIASRERGHDDSRWRSMARALRNAGLRDGQDDWTVAGAAATRTVYRARRDRRGRNGTRLSCARSDPAAGSGHQDSARGSCRNPRRPAG